MRMFFFASIVVVVLSFTAAATIIHVPGEYSTIQAGINAAVNGDTVLVADGIYTGAGNKNLDFTGKAIVVLSENGPDNCIIDCEDEGRGLYFHSNEIWTSVLSGLKIINGNVTGIYPENRGGGIRCYYSSPTIANCTISENSSSDLGGGIYCYESSPTITNCTISDNTAANSGGGIHNFANSNPTIINCTIIGNSTDARGGGIGVLYLSSPTIENCTIMGNSASYDGGGIRCGNESNPTIINCTIYGNSADVIGGGIACWYSNITGVNNIIWANSAPADSQIYIDPGSSSTCTYSDIQGGYAGTGNIDSDPLFVNGPCGDCYLSQIASGQAVNSPCVDTGDPASPMIVGTTRTDGVQDAGVIDMGYHYSLNLSFPQIVITLTPTNPPIQIPANGGMFEFNVEMANNEASAVTFDVWTLVTLPNGSEYGPVIGPLELTLNPGVSVDRDRTQNVPAGAPSGDYTYDAYVGIYPYFVWDEDHIDFEKLADSDNGSFVSNWENWGESFEGFAENSSLTTPDDYTVLTACPNPFNPTTAISYKLQAASFVNLTIFDITGREVARLVDGYRSAGMHNVAFDGADLSSGIYFARLNAGSFTQTQKLLLVK